ncbi:hypothetical protein HMPREF3226_02354 [Prevotella corporis]|uniref:Uncharacterized protein n=1 Tax=Prevotella corporis TaxID=28128 RepID=A0A133PW84_9BACT|nr:hypothetical protein HMPREF3226_02354 [Prevotella corporis]
MNCIHSCKAFGILYMQYVTYNQPNKKNHDIGPNDIPVFRYSAPF